MGCLLTIQGHPGFCNKVRRAVILISALVAMETVEMMLKNNWERLINQVVVVVVEAKLDCLWWPMQKKEPTLERQGMNCDTQQIRLCRGYQFY